MGFHNKVLPHSMKPLIINEAKVSNNMNSVRSSSQVLRYMRARAMRDRETFARKSLFDLESPPHSQVVTSLSLPPCSHILIIIEFSDASPVAPFANSSSLICSVFKMY